MYNFKKTCLPIIGFLLIFNSCVSKKQVLYFQDILNHDISKISSSQNILQENDILQIDVTSFEMKASVYYNKVSSQNIAANSLEIMQINGYLVSNKKTINFPVLGEVSVANKTTLDLENYLKKRLENEGHLIKPNVSVRLLNGKVTVLGEVNRVPGTYTFTEKNINFLQAIGLAGDLTIDGNRKDINLLLGKSDGVRKTTKQIDMTSLRVG